MDVTKTGSVRVFEGSARIRASAMPSHFTVDTERFSPLLDKSIMFHFRASYNVRAQNSPNFKLALVRSPDSERYPSLVMSVDVRVSYDDGTLFHKYEHQSNIKFDHMNTFHFATVNNKIYCRQEVWRNVMQESNEFINVVACDMIICYKMTFNDDIPKTTLPENVRGSSSKFSSNLKCVYESAVFNDFVFNVGDKSFPVHRVILVAHSPVFMTMMTQDFEESKTGSVTITDTTPEVFEMFLKYLYCGEIEDKSWPSVKDLYCLADKYDVGILKNDCTDIIISLLSIDLVCEILKLAYMYDDSSIKTAAKKFSVVLIKKLISREDWKELVVMHPSIGYEVIVNFVPT